MKTAPRGVETPTASPLDKRSYKIQTQAITINHNWVVQQEQ